LILVFLAPVFRSIFDLFFSSSGTWSLVVFFNPKNALSDVGTMPSAARAFSPDADFELFEPVLWMRASLLFVGHMNLV